MDGISFFDIVVGVIILFLGLKGLLDGFVKEFFGLAGIIGGIYYGSRYADVIGKFISDNIFVIKNEAALTFVGFITGLFTIWLAMVLLGSLVTKLTHASGMGMLNKLLGLLFGWAKIFLIIAVLIYAVSSIEAFKGFIAKYTKNSVLYPVLVKTGGYIIKLKPQEFIGTPVKEQTAQTTKELQTDIKNETSKIVEKKIKEAIETNLSKEQ
ncbi:CvpA family protein [Nitratiruptor sp. YY09-18]|uniref:CvpA family protein n=1 Tax=Nitratiruptor sp. YY09-18 TaxID=2724901 RepID=UPI00191691BB|nr:CvpA family protein [Nitratiruptor sp. YY09-18]BCD67823.1 membrane protein required for colicin V production [Nitratiruptor sp. YY09-18]